MVIIHKDGRRRVLELERNNGVFGAVPNFIDSNSIDFTYDAITNNVTASVILSKTPENAIIELPDGEYAPQILKRWVVYGGIVTWISGYTYSISASGYYLNGNFYTSPQTIITLSPPDSTFNRIDSFIVNDQGQALVLEGVPSSNPAQPAIDIGTQLQLSFALVETGTTEPTINADCIYKENIEWASTSSTVRINPNSASTPYEGAKDIEGTNVVPNDYIKFTTTPLSPIALYTQITFRIKIKPSWNNSNGAGASSLMFQFLDGSSLIGGSVILKHNKYGLDGNNTTTYQLISIPLSDFGLNNSSVIDTLKIIYSSSSSSPKGFFLDNICLQNQIISPPPTVGTVTNFSAGNLNPIFTTSVSNPTTTPNLAFNLSNALSNSVFGNFTASLTTPTYNQATIDNTFLVRRSGLLTFGNIVYSDISSLLPPPQDLASVLTVGNTDPNHDIIIGGVLYSQYPTVTTGVTRIRMRHNIAAAGGSIEVQSYSGGTWNDTGTLQLGQNGGIVRVGAIESSLNSWTKINFPAGTGGGSIATGDIFYNGSDSYIKRLAIGSSNNVLTVVGGLPVWQVPSSGEINTASNLGGGLSNFDSKSGVDLRFNSFAASDFDLASNLITIDSTLKSTWNNKQDAISLTTIGASGATTFISNVLNVPNYTYTLPTASTTVLGGVKVDGTTITITGGVISSSGGSSSLTQYYVGVGNVSNVLSGTSSLQFQSDILKIGASSTGQINLSGNAAFQGQIKYDSGPAYLYIDNTWDSSASQTLIRMRTAGTAINAVKVFGSGKIQLGSYGIGTFAGTPLFALGVDSIGNVVEGIAASGANFILNQASLQSSSNFHISADGQIEGILYVGGTVGSSSINGKGISSQAAATNTVFNGAPANNANFIGSSGYWALRTGTSGDANLDVYNSGSPVVALKFLQSGYLRLPVTPATYSTGTYDVLVRNQTTGNVEITTISGGSGEANTASNLGGGLANFDSKSGVDLRFNSFASSDFDLASNVITIDSTLKSTWNNKQDTITLTTTGTSGVATFIANSLNIPNYTYTLPTASTTVLGGVKVDGTTVTITGGVISASGGSGTVTSVAATISGALGVTGTPITTTGTLVFAWQGSTSQYVRGDGSLISIPTTISGITADNGLTAPTFTNVQLGGTLLQNTTIATGANNLAITTATAITNPFSVSSTSGVAIYAAAGSGQGIFAVSASSYGVIGQSDSGIAGLFRVRQSTANTVEEVLRVERQSTGTPSNGIGGAITFTNMVSDGTTLRQTSQLVSKLTDATDATRTSQFIITGVNSAVTADLFTLSGSGALKLNKYGSNTFTGTPTSTLQSTSTGDIIEGPIITSGVYTPTVANTTNISGTGIHDCHYSRMGNEVHVAGQLTMTATAANTTTTFTVTLPTSTANFTSVVQAAGTLEISNGSVSVGGVVYAAIGGPVVWFSYYAPNTSSQDLHFNFTYTIQ